MQHIHGLAIEHFGLHGRIKQLPGEIDLNYQLTLHSGHKFVLKIANPATERAQLELQNALMQHLAERDLGLEIPRPVPSLAGERITEIAMPTDGSRRFLRLLTWIEGRCFADTNPHPPALLESVGEMCGKLAAGLADFDHPAAHRFLKWDISQAAWTREHLPKIADAGKRQLAEHFLQQFENQAVPAFSSLRKSICYNDANDYNILVSHDLLAPRVPGVIDFGDAVFTHTVNELAIAAAYCAMHKPDPITAIAHVVAGFHRAFPLTEKEVEMLFALIGARLLVSVTCSAINLAEHPENKYLQISDRPAWALLEKLRAVPPALAHCTFRHACGWEPSPRRAAFEAWARANFQKTSPIVPGWPPQDSGAHSSIVWLDLSVGSPDLGTWADIEDAEKLHQRIAAAMQGGEPF